MEIEYFLRSGKDITIFFMPGLGCSKNSFWGAIKDKRLNPYSLVSVDLPGTGNSSYPKDSSLDFYDLVKIIRLFINHLKIKKTVLIGHSTGGVIALLYAKKYPDRILGLVNVEGNLEWGPGPAWSEKVRKMGYKKLKKAYIELKEKLRKSKNKNSERYARDLDNTDSKAYFDYSVSHARYSRNGKLMKKFIELKIPKIFVYGSKNRTWLKTVKKLKSANCPVAEIPKSHHFSFFDNPKKFYQTILDFVMASR